MYGAVVVIFYTEDVFLIVPTNDFIFLNFKKKTMIK